MKLRLDYVPSDDPFCEDTVVKFSYPRNSKVCYY